MVQPVWRDVAAPDFSGSLQGIYEGGNLISQAGRGLGDSLLQMQQNNRQQAQDNNDSLLLSRAAQITDPNQFRQALSSGSLFQGINPAMVSSKAAAMLNAHLGELQNARQADHNYQLGEQFDAPMNQAKLTGAQLNNQGQALSNASGAFQLQNAQKAYADNQTANRFVQGFVPQYTDLDGARAGLLNNKDFQALSPEAQQVAMARIGSTYGGNLYGPVQMANMGAGGNNPYTQLNSWAGSMPTSKPLTNMTLGEVGDLQDQMINKTKGKIGQGNNGTSALGAGQMTKGYIANYAPSVLGSDWQNQQFTPQVQDQLRQAGITDALSKSNPAASLKTTFASLKDVPDQVLNNASPDQIDRFVLAGENNGGLQQTLQDYNMTNNAAQLALGNRQGQLNMPVAGQEWINNGSNQNDASTVASNLVQNDPRFKGGDERQITGLISDISNRAGVTPSRAAQLLSAAGTTHSALNAITSLGGRIGNWDSNLSSNFTYDKSRLNSLIKDASDQSANGLDNRVLSSMQTGMVGNQANAALQMAQGANAQYMAALQRARTQPQLIASGEIERLRQNAARANAMLTGAFQQVNQNLGQGATAQSQPSTATLVNQFKPKATPKLSSEEQNLIKMNALRQRQGLPPLVMAPEDDDAFGPGDDSSFGPGTTQVENPFLRR